MLHRIKWEDEKDSDDDDEDDEAAASKKTAPCVLVWEVNDKMGEILTPLISFLLSLKDFFCNIVATGQGIRFVQKIIHHDLP